MFKCHIRVKVLIINVNKLLNHKNTMCVLMEPKHKDYVLINLSHHEKALSFVTIKRYPVATESRKAVFRRFCGTAYFEKGRSCASTKSILLNLETFKNYLYVICLISAPEGLDRHWLIAGRGRLGRAPPAPLWLRACVLTLHSYIKH